MENKKDEEKVVPGVKDNKNNNVKKAKKPKSSSTSKPKPKTASTKSQPLPANNQNNSENIKNKEDVSTNKEINKADQKAKDKQELEKVKLEIKRIKALKKERKVADKKVLTDSLEKLEQAYLNSTTLTANETPKDKSANDKETKESKVTKESKENKDKESQEDTKINDMRLESSHKENIKKIKSDWKEKYVKGYWDNEDQSNIIEIREVEKYYISLGNVTPVLKKMNVDIKKGSVIAILGPSGSGKTTLLNLISGLDTAQAGDIIVNNRNLRYLSDSNLTKFRAANVSFIFQSYNLLPTLNVIENVKTGSQLQKDKEKKLDELELLKKLELFDERYKYPYQLSGGQQQRVSIARALAKNPAILFADEPTGALDTDTSVQVLETLMKVNKDFGTTIVIVTHNLLISKICDQIIRIKNGNINKITNNPKPLSPSEIKWE